MSLKHLETEYSILIKRYFWPILSAIASCIFGAFNFLAVRRIGKHVHSSIKTMWLGLTAFVLCSFFLCFYIPHRLIEIGKTNFWKEQFSFETFLFTLVLSSLFYVCQESLSIALENVKAGSVATLSFISIIISHFGYKFYQEILAGKKVHANLSSHHHQINTHLSAISLA